MGGTDLVLRLGGRIPLARRPARKGNEVDIKQELLALMESTLHLGGRTSDFTDERPLLGSLPELDSMGVVALITAMEERFGFTVDDDEIDGSVFHTVGTLTDFIAGKLAS